MAENAVDQNSEMHTVDVKEWPNINIPRWREWGFKPEYVLRTPKYNFLVQRALQKLEYREDGEKAFILEGRWFRIDEKDERTLERLSWAALLLVILIFTLTLRIITIGTAWSSIAALMLFAFIYIVDGIFMAYALKGLAGETEEGRLEIRWGEIRRVVHIAKQGVMLLEWDSDGKRISVGFRINPETGDVLIAKLQALGTQGSVIIREAEATFKNPPEIKKE